MPIFLAVITDFYESQREYEIDALTQEDAQRIAVSVIRNKPSDQFPTNESDVTWLKAEVATIQLAMS